MSDLIIMKEKLMREILGHHINHIVFDAPEHMNDVFKVLIDRIVMEMTIMGDWGWEHEGDITNYLQRTR